MGKKKQQKEAKPSKADEKGNKKVYSLPSSKQDGVSSAAESLQKVVLPASLERDLLDLIQSAGQSRLLDKDVSKRLTQKKLMDIYTSLGKAGFAHKQIEQAMDSTILHGGDLIDALDWLCLNIPNDKLPANFSAALEREEEKLRPRMEAYQDVAEEQPPDLQDAVKVIQKTRTATVEPRLSAPANKDWILQYAGQELDSGLDSLQEEGEEPDYDPNERYLLLTALLLDCKTEASEIKKSGNKENKEQLKDLTKTIKEYVNEMNTIEQDPLFNPLIKLRDVDASTSQLRDGSTSAGQSIKSEDPKVKSHDQVVMSHDQSGGLSCDPSHKSDNEEDMGLSLFQSSEKDPPPKEKAVKVVKDVRNFEYTRQQWTGKSPKQFLIDWVRKHLPNSPPPKFEKRNHGGYAYKCIVRVERKKEGTLELCPDILCGTVQNAEHLAATLALYNLCKGQAVYQLLPPPYRDVWMEWSDAEKLAAEEEKSKENKPRDQYLAKLFSKVQVSDKSDQQGSKGQSGSGVKVANEEDVLESWENMESSEDNQDVQMASSTVPKPQKKAGHKNAATKSARDLYIRNTLQSELTKVREQLPVYQHKAAILETIRRHSVVLVAGETGSGKSTQVPHFILEDCLLTGSESCNIVCTEPRRISATSLAVRVSQEMGERKLGGIDSLCGYQIRFESRCGPDTRLTYCTTGVLLRKLQLDPALSNVSHIIVDEVHERSVQSDFLLIILRQLLTKRSDLKVILMSATLDAEKFSSYFKHCPVINIPGRTFSVKVYHVEDVLEQTGYVLEEDSPFSLRQSELVSEESASLSVTGKGGDQSKLDVHWTKEDIAQLDTSGLSVEKYSLKTRNTISRMNLKKINVDLIIDLLVHIDTSPSYAGLDGAVLVFLPGLADITELYEILTTDRRFTDKNRYRVIALHSVLSSADQAQAFSVPPQGVRKVVLATNIAETGITIPDVVFVIDTGKVKENRYIESSQMSTLEEVLISRANAKQRQGRAGRVREGICFRMFTKRMYDDMKAYTIPELLRVPLEELCLHIMKCNYGKPEVFLSGALDPPQGQVVARAMGLLHAIGACIEGERLTPLGHHLSALPVYVRIGKMLLYAAILDCLEPVAVIAACMTDKSPFVVPMGKQDAVSAVKQSLAVAASDHLTLYKVFCGWQEVRSKGRQAEMSYCQKNFLKRNTLLEIDNVKNDLIKLLSSIGFANKACPLQSEIPDSDLVKDGVLQITKYPTPKALSQKTIAKVKAILTAGLYPNVAKVMYEAPVDAGVNPDKRVCVAETQQGPAHVHPSSVNRNLQANGWLVFHEKVKSTRIYLRDCTLVSPYALLLFGGEIHVHHTDQVVSVDDRIKYKAYAKTGVMFRELRKLLDDLLAKKLEDPSLNISDDRVVGLLEELLESERTR